ncbi:MAG: TolC family protein [Arcobacteraceae bacterium]|nr:TolC family protein [Arcobacteraceae bacterium]
MQKFLSTFLSTLLVFLPTLANAEGAVKIAKSTDKTGENKDMPKPKNIDKEYGKEGTLNESKSALISVDPLALQNYSKISNNFDFSTYDKVTLKSVILETLSQSNDLKSANEKVIQTELSYKEAYAGYLPTVDFQYSVKKTHNLETGDDTIDKPYHSDYNDESYKFTIRQSLYTGGATEFKVKSLKSKLEEAKRKYTIVLEEEIQKAIKAYFGVLFSHKSVVVNERNMEKLNKILEITQIKYDSGALSIGDLSAVKANIANASGKLIRVKSDLADAIDFYLYTVGEDFTKTAPYEENFPIKLTTLEALYADILENNLNLVNYRLNIQSTKDKLLNMKATFKPKVDLELNYANVLDKEQFTANEETYNAKVTLNYNLYNGGKDTIAAMQVFSSLQELNYRYKEEIKKLKWEISKLFNSIKSLDETLSNTKKEVSASAEMVNSYWEGFQLGEQDLQVLLQGQRQLNGAELDLIKYEQDYLTNVFKLLTSKGELSKYFNIDGGHPDFIDFSNTTGTKTPLKIDLTNTINNTKDMNKTIEPIATKDENLTQDENITHNDENETIGDLNTTVDEYLEVVKEAGFENVVNFKDTFLEANDEDYTIAISDFTNHYDAYTYAKKNRILNQSFSYEYLNKNGDFEKVNTKTKVVDVKTSLAFGIYKSQDEAIKSVDTIFDKGGKLYNIVKVKEIKELYNAYVNGLEAKVEPFIVKPKVVKTFMTNQEFKNKFLSAPSSYYSINVISLSQMEQAQNLIKQENIEKDSFVFRYGRNGMWVKVMFGVFSSYEQAMSELSKHPDMIAKYRPVIEKIGQKQDTYNTYKDFNPTPQWYLDEQKEKKEKKDSKVAPKADEKKTNSKEEVVVVSPEDITIEEPLALDTNKSIETKSVELPKKEEITQPLSNETIVKEEEPKVENIEALPPQSQISEPTNENEVVPEISPTEKPKVELVEEKSIAPIENKEEVRDPIVETPIEELPKVEAITPKVNEAPLKSKTEIFKQENYPSFTEAFNNAPKGYYTIALETIPDTQRDRFIQQFISDDQFTEVSNKGKTQIYYGIFENIEKAREQKFNLHPHLIAGVKLFKIDRIDKNILSMLKDKIKTVDKPMVVPSVELPKKEEITQPLSNETIVKEEEPKVENIEALPPQSQISEPTNENEVVPEISPTEKPKVELVEEKSIAPIENKEEVRDPIVETPIEELPKVEAITPKEEKTKTESINQEITIPTVNTPTSQKIEGEVVQERIQEKTAPIEEPKVKVQEEDIVAPIENKEETKAFRIETPVEELPQVEIATPTIKELPLKTEPETFKKENYPSFTEAFKNAPKEYYTIALGTIPNNQKDAFVKRFIMDDQFAEVSNKGKTQIYYGIFENIEKAREQKVNLHPKLVNSVKLIKIERIAK